MRHTEPNCHRNVMVLAKMTRGLDIRTMLHLKATRHFVRHTVAELLNSFPNMANTPTLTLASYGAECYT